MDEQRATLVVRHQHGLHARPADLFVRKANEFQAKIEVSTSRDPQRKSTPKASWGS